MSGANIMVPKIVEGRDKIKNINKIKLNKLKYSSVLSVPPLSSPHCFLSSLSAYIAKHLCSPSASLALSLSF